MSESSRRSNVHPNSLHNLQKGREKRATQLDKKKKSHTKQCIENQLKQAKSDGYTHGYETGYTEGYKAGVESNNSIILNLNSTITSANNTIKSLKKKVVDLKNKLSILRAKIVNWDTKTYIMNHFCNIIKDERNEYHTRYKNKFVVII